MTRVFIGMGSNLEEPARQLARAADALARLPDTSEHRFSPVYVSEPMGPQNQPSYLNAVVSMDTMLSPSALLAALQHIEIAQGRVRNERWGARTLDLDILLYGEEVIDTPELQIPHPGLAHRKFVLQPLKDLVGANFVLPGGIELGTLAADCPGAGLEPAPWQWDSDN